MRMIAALGLALLMGGTAPAWLYRIAWDYDIPATFRVYRDGQLIGETAVNVFVDFQITQGSEYVYAVTAVVDGVESAPSDPLAVSTGIRGDFDGDGLVTAADCDMLSRYLAGSGGTATRRSDLDDDFTLTAADLALLLLIQ